MTTITAGDGLSGGGLLDQDRTIDVDASVVRTSGNQTIAGVKTFSSTITGSISGNAGTATTLQTARTIGGVSFNGSANINLPGVNTAGNQNTTGSAASLTTARTINGVSFNGTANITLPTVNTSGDQTTIAGAKTFTGNVRVASFGVNTAASGTAGEIRATNNITAFFSDDRLKTRLKNIEEALEKISTLDAFYYIPNKTAIDLGYEEEQHIGLSAQQVNKIFPEVVRPAPIDDKYLTIQYDKLIPLLVAGIKELKEEVSSLKKIILRDE